MADGAIGNAYVTVKPKVDSGFGKEIEGKAESSGSGFGAKFSGAAKSAISAGAVAMGNILSNAVQSVASNLGQVFTDMFQGAMDFEQLAGGVEKIFDQADISGIMADANAAYKDLNMSANEYLASINQTGAAFAQTMGDQKGYDTARTGMKAIADYASGTGRNIDELNDKFSLITRATSSYQSIADQFSGILPATSKDFLAQAQAAGFLSDSYKSLTEVPIAEYQEAVAKMLEKGVDDMGLAGNTAMESAETMSGSLAMLKSSWSNFLSGILDDDADLSAYFGALLESVMAVARNFLPRIGLLFVRAFAQLPKAIYDAIMSLPDTMLPALQAVFGEQMGQAISDDMRGALEFVSSSVSDLMGGIMDAVMPVVEAVTKTVQDNLPKVQAIVGSVMTFVGNVVKTVWPVVSNIILGAVNTISAIITNVWPQISDIISNVMATVQSVIDTTWPAIQDLITSVMTAIDAVMSVAWPIIQSVVTTVMSAVLSVIQTVWPTIRTIVTTAVNVIKGAINGISSVVSAVTSTFNRIKTAMTNPIETAKGIISGIINTIKGWFNNFHVSLPHISLPHFSISPSGWQVGDLLKGTIPSLGISWYAEGGIVDGATLIGAGEAGPEMILPKSGGLMDDFSEAITSRIDMQEVVDELREFRREIGPIISDYAPTATPREMRRIYQKVNAYA